MKPEHVVLFMGIMEYPEVAAWREATKHFVSAIQSALPLLRQGSPDQLVLTPIS